MGLRQVALFAVVLACLAHPTVATAQKDNGPLASNSQPPDSGSDPVAVVYRSSSPDDFNRNIYYKNRLELSLETGLLPANIPFVFDFLVSDNYTRNPISYSLVPIFLSLRWQVDNVRGPSFLRGNTDLTFTSSLTVIPRGPESRYAAFDFGVRRNFVPRRWRAAPYFEARGGVGTIDAKGPKGILWAQGQDLTFTLMLGSGLRYNISPRYSVSAGVSYMHVSNAYLSEPKYEDFGINVYGPMVGIDIRLGKPRQK